jgi:rRNA maturation RNase YbeY
LQMRNHLHLLKFPPPTTKATMKRTTTIATNSLVFNQIIRREVDGITRGYFEAFERRQIALPILSLSLVSQKQMHAINSKYRGRAHSTDILAFPSTTDQSELVNGLKEVYLNSIIYNHPANHLQLGHLVVCPKVLMQRFKKKKFTLLEKSISSILLVYGIRRLLIHGFAHLFHFDHHSWKDFVQMQRFEMKLFKSSMIMIKDC